MAIELFHFRGLLMLWGTTFSTGLDRYWQRGKVKGAGKTQITICGTLVVTLAIEQVPERQEVAHVATPSSASDAAVSGTSSLKIKKKLIGAPRFELGTSCAQVRRNISWKSFLFNLSFENK